MVYYLPAKSYHIYTPSILKRACVYIYIYLTYLFFFLYFLSLGILYIYIFIHIHPNAREYIHSRRSIS